MNECELKLAMNEMELEMENVVFGWQVCTGKQLIENLLRSFI